MEADCFSGSCPQKVIPGHEFLVAIKRESHFPLEQNSVLCFVRIFGVQVQKDSYTAKCRH